MLVGRMKQKKSVDMRNNIKIGKLIIMLVCGQKLVFGVCNESARKAHMSVQ